ncbi:hypothetical protein [Streptomyces katrae]|uniref:Uncharacterized protein n=1 Tax=Streptomyces katrae TaxID=68223 RepID=A0A0F4IYN0_9ACTN|nr:hypothetical protein [Streptomyces katrae]KJY26769.1 hypothetical protein VR44_29270 [Streptomyces katrae]
MSAPSRAYRYVGPHHVIAAVQTANSGAPIRTPADFADWAAAQSAGELKEPLTFVIGTDGALLLAPRRSEHAACAGGGLVLSAGEVSFASEAGRWIVTEVSNQSTGYCPDVASWPAVAQALDQAALDHPDYFTHPVLFRRCPGCHRHNIVREGHFVCVFCDADLPRRWNVDTNVRDPGTP